MKSNFDYNDNIYKNYLLYATLLYDLDYLCIDTFCFIYALLLILIIIASIQSPPLIHKICRKVVVYNL